MPPVAFISNQAPTVLRSTGPWRPQEKGVSFSRHEGVATSRVEITTPIFRLLAKGKGKLSPPYNYCRLSICRQTVEITMKRGVPLSSPKRSGIISTFVETFVLRCLIVPCIFSKNSNIVRSCYIFSEYRLLFFYAHAFLFENTMWPFLFRDLYMTFL